MQPKTLLAGLVLASGVVVAPVTAFAESASRTGDGGDFLDGVTCGGAPCFDPNAGGQKIFGTLTVVYDKQPNDITRCPTPPFAFVKNMFVNLTMDQGNLRVPFTTDYLSGPPSHATGFCLLTQRVEQVKVIIELIRAKVIPFYFSCDPAIADSCPAFRIKTVANFQYTTGHPSLAPYPYSGGFSADIVIATP